jgi:hypothetical protein
MIVRLPCFLALRSPLLIAPRIEVSPMPVRALASSGDTASRSESATFPLCPNSFITQPRYPEPPECAYHRPCIDLRRQHWLGLLSPTTIGCSSFDPGDSIMRLLGTAAKKERIDGFDLAHMMPLAVPKQNGCQKRVVQLDAKASERRGSLYSLLL